MLRAQASMTSAERSDDGFSEKRQLQSERNKHREKLRSEDHRHKAKMDGTAVSVKRQRSVKSRDCVSLAHWLLAVLQ